MIDPINLVKQVMSQDLTTVNGISQKMANVNTYGYRADISSSHLNQKIFSIKGDTLKTEELSVFGSDAGSNGALLQTGRGLDFALQGRGFFTLDIEGVYYLSRNGNFTRDKDGYLTNSSGAYVHGENGRILVNGKDLSINSEGELILDGELLDRLKISLPVNNQLRHLGNGLYKARQLNDAPIHTHNVQQGYLESSNVDVAAEMIQLMSTQRHFGMMQRYMSIYDGMLDTSINELGK